MSGGYTPLFASLTTGTLCGKWPDVGLWPIVLSLSTRQGVVDVTPAYIASITGLVVEEVTACMKRFCAPDAYSRSSEEKGARLLLIDPEHRDWGWLIVNHRKYREKARKTAFDATRAEDGRNAERMAARRESTRQDPARPPQTRANPLSDSDSDLRVKHTQTQPATCREASQPVATVAKRPLARTVLPEFHQLVIELYRELLPILPTVKTWNKKRAASLNARIAERIAAGKPADEISYWRGFFEKVAASDFLSGRATGFRPSLEWLLKEENFLKVIEGNYNASHGRSTGANHAR